MKTQLFSSKVQHENNLTQPTGDCSFRGFSYGLVLKQMKYEYGMISPNESITTARAVDHTVFTVNYLGNGIYK